MREREEAMAYQYHSGVKAHGGKAQKINPVEDDINKEDEERKR